MMIQTLSRVLLFLSLTLLPLPALALPILSISSPGGDGVFVLYGAQMSGVAGLDVTVGFDGAALGNPRVAMGSLVSGMMSASNPGNPIRMAIVGTKALSGSGVIATITFDRTGSSPGSITLLTASLIDAAGKKVLMAAPVVTNPPQPSTSESGSGEGQTGGSSGNGGGSGGSGGTGTTGETSGSGVSTPKSGGYVGGTLTIPGQETAGQEGTTIAPPSGDDYSSSQETQRRVRTRRQPNDAEPQLEPGDNTASQSQGERGGASGANGKPVQVAEPVKIDSVLAKFRDFKGELTPANLTALFALPPQAQYTQVPAVVLADGKATVTLDVFINVGDATPRFSFGDCSYVSYSRIEKGWEIQARPDRDAVSASIAVLYNGQRQEFPLVVAPAVRLSKKGQKKVTEADFQRFLADRGTGAAPRFDLNKDGKRDYIDDYIYTANYLVQTKEVK